LEQKDAKNAKEKHAGAAGCQRRCKIGNCVRIHGVVAAVPGGFRRFSSAPEDGRHHTADLAPLRRL